VSVILNVKTSEVVCYGILRSFSLLGKETSYYNLSAMVMESFDP
jgi:hypothetical protein